ncbi:hypothetical protein N8463_03635 [Synechococcus sp. AH-601-P06]|nr:hypothetical protein [Synechococcus sp. AH-601-P06]
MLDLPDIANFPDYRSETRYQFADSQRDYDKRIYSLISGDFNGFVHNLDLSNAPWASKLEYFFDFYRRHQKPDYSVTELSKGVIAFKEDISFLTKLVSEDISYLMSLPDWTPPPGTFDRGKQMPHLAGIIQEFFDSLGILNFSSDYIKKSLKVSNVVLHVSKPTDLHWKQFFYDAVTTPKYTNAHIDPKECVVKSMIYLNKVNQKNGAFSYAISSNKNFINPVQNIFGRAISTSSYCHSPESRSSVFSLPSNLRVSHNFGRCLFPGMELWSYLEQKFRCIESDDANIIVFDPGAGIHQGGICTAGHRHALQILMK